MKKGFVYLVGAGPGEPGLITLRGAELLKTADCVIYDRLANPDLLRFARTDAETIPVPKRDGTGLFTQQQINKLLIEKASSRQTIVRLKGGDPCIFGRCTEEITALAEAGIGFEIVPGITAGIAAAAYTGIILTDRKYSSQVIFVTGHEAEAKPKSNIDWQLLAKFSGTIVFYMAMANLDFIAEQLIKNGMSAQTPAAAIANVSLPSQSTVRASLRKLGQKCKESKIEPPAIVVIGSAAASETPLNWFAQRPLSGSNIVVTGHRRGNAEFAAKIVRRAGIPLQLTTIKIKPLTQTNQFLQTLARITAYDWVIFTSANGAIIFFDCLQGLGKDTRVFGSAKIAAIGSGTAAKLGEFGIKPDFVPTVFTSSQLGKQLISFANLQGRKVLLLRSRLASSELEKVLAQAGAQIDNVPIYSITPEKLQSSQLIKEITEGRIDWLTFASPSSARIFFEQFQIDLVNSGNVKVASIGPVTSEQLKNLGVRVHVQADEHTVDGLLNAMEKSEKLKRKLKKQ